MKAAPIYRKALASTTATTVRTPVSPSTAVTVALRNRQAMPRVAAAVDTLRRVFGPVRVTHALENGCELRTKETRK